MLGKQTYHWDLYVNAEINVTGKQTYHWDLYVNTEDKCWVNKHTIGICMLIQK